MVQAIREKVDNLRKLNSTATFTTNKHLTRKMVTINAIKKIPDCIYANF